MQTDYTILDVMGQQRLTDLKVKIWELQKEYPNFDLEIYEEMTHFYILGRSTYVYSILTDNYRYRIDVTSFDAQVYEVHKTYLGQTIATHILGVFA